MKQQPTLEGALQRVREDPDARLAVIFAAVFAGSMGFALGFALGEREDSRAESGGLARERRGTGRTSGPAVDG
jgi:hypothetical protein